jgi:tRNA (guanine9-N1)-methyltransferase
MSTEEETASILTEDIDKPLKISKNQQRKQKRYELMLERRKSKRKEEKAKQKQRRRDKLKNNSEDQSLITRHSLKYNLMENSSCRIRICMDCRYDSMMNDKDIGSLQKQIAFCYSANRRSLAPCQFYITNVNGQLEKRLEINSATNWDIYLRNESLEKVFPHDDILYLTSESENVLSSIEPLDEQTVYVIGGIVDHNSKKGLCHQLAIENKWRHARLPIDEFIKLNTRRVLACNHVMEILLNYIQLGDWKQAFEQNIPKRKQQIEADINDDIPQTVSPNHPEEPKPCAEIHERRGEIDEGEDPPPLNI